MRRLFSIYETIHYANMYHFALLAYLSTPYVVFFKLCLKIDQVSACFRDFFLYLAACFVTKLPPRNLAGLLEIFLYGFRN